MAQSQSRSHVPRTPIARDSAGADRSRLPAPQPLARHDPGAAIGPPHNLPTFLTRFIGRQHAVVAITGLLGSYRLLTLTGPGGCGKTRLACAVAAARAAADPPSAFPAGFWYVEFASLTDPALVAQAIAAVLGVREEPHRPLIETLGDALRPRAALLLLDNWSISSRRSRRWRTDCCAPARISASSPPARKRCACPAR